MISTELEHLARVRAREGWGGRRAFLTFLTTVVSRGDHAAIALRDRVVASRGA